MTPPPPGVGFGVGGALLLGEGDGVELELRVATGPERCCAAASSMTDRCAGCLAFAPERAAKGAVPPAPAPADFPGCVAVLLVQGFAAGAPCTPVSHMLTAPNDTIESPVNRPIAGVSASRPVIDSLFATIGGFCGLPVRSLTRENIPSYPNPTPGCDSVCQPRILPGIGRKYTIQFTGNSRLLTRDTACRRRW